MLMIWPSFVVIFSLQQGLIRFKTISLFDLFLWEFNAIANFISSFYSQYVVENLGFFFLKDSLSSTV